MIFVTRRLVEGRQTGRTWTQLHLPRKEQYLFLPRKMKRLRVVGCLTTRYYCSTTAGGIVVVGIAIPTTACGSRIVCWRKFLYLVLNSEKTKIRKRTYIRGKILHIASKDRTDTWRTSSRKWNDYHKFSRRMQRAALCTTCSPTFFLLGDFCYRTWTNKSQRSSHNGHRAATHPLSPKSTPPTSQIFFPIAGTFSKIPLKTLCPHSTE